MFRYVRILALVANPGLGSLHGRMGEHEQAYWSGKRGVTKCDEICCGPHCGGENFEGGAVRAVTVAKFQVRMRRGRVKSKALMVPHAGS